jgi:hypothetical protein
MRSATDDNGVACHTYARVDGHFEPLLSVKCVLLPHSETLLTEFASVCDVTK